MLTNRHAGCVFLPRIEYIFKKFAYLFIAEHLFVMDRKLLTTLSSENRVVGQLSEENLT